jgi:hypothetical protein
VLWHAPSYQVSIDGRAELYRDLLPVYARVVAADGWRAELDREGVDVALVPRDGPLDRAMRADAGWAVAVADARATVLVRTR